MKSSKYVSLVMSGFGILAIISLFTVAYMVEKDKEQPSVVLSEESEYQLAVTELVLNCLEANGVYEMEIQKQSTSHYCLEG